MTDDVRDRYDVMAEKYTAVNLDALDQVPADRARLAAFAELAGSCGGTVADLGCGPGHVVDHLIELGLDVVGYDISPGQVAEARKAFPDREFHLGDFTSLNIADSSLGGIVSRYSLIHMGPSRLRGVFDEWVRALEPGAPVLVSFFASSSAEAHGTSFDHAVVTAYELFPATIVGLLEDAGFDRLEVTTRDPLAGERPLGHATIIARAAGIDSR